MATELAKAYVQIVPSAQGIQGSITSALSGEGTSAGESTGKSFASSFGSVAKKALVGLGIGKIIKDAIGDASEFETAMAKTSTLFSGSAEEFDALKGQILDLSSVYGVSATTLAEAAYSAESASVPMEQLGTMLESSAKLAQAGFTDIDTALSATAKTMNAYGDAAMSAEDIQKVLIQTQNLGITTVGELGASLANVTPTAAAMGVSFDQVGAAMAQMTAQGVPTAQATTQLRAAMTELGKSGTTADKAFREAAKGTKYAGKGFKEVMASGANLGDVFGMMQAYADRSGKSMVDLWGSVEAGNAAMMIASDVNKFNSNLKQMSTSADVVDEAYGKMANTFGNSMNRLKESAKNFMTTLFEGGDISTAFDNMLSSLGDVGGKLMTWLTNGLRTLSENLPDMMESLLHFGEGILDSLANVDWISLGTTIINGIIGAIGTLGTHLIELVGSAINSVVEGDIDFAAIGKSILGGVESIITTTGSWLKTLFEAAKNAICGEGGINFAEIGTKILDGVKSVLDEAGKFLANLFGFGRDAAASDDMGYDGIGTAILNGVKSILDEAGSFLGDLFSAGLSAAEEQPWPTVGEAIKTGVNLVLNGGKFLSEVFNAGAELIQAINWTNVGSHMENLIVNGLDGAAQLVSTVSDAADSMISGIDWKSVGQEAGNLICTGLKAAANLVGAITDAAADLISGVNWENIGSSAGELVCSGLKGAAKIVDAVSDSADRLLTSINWESIGNSASDLISTGLSGAAGLLETGFKGAIALLENTPWADIGKNISSGLGEVWGGLTGFIGGLFSGAGELVEGIGHAGGTAFEALGDLIARAINGDDMEKAAENLKTTMGDLEAAISAGETTIKETAKAIGKGIRTSINTEVSSENMTKIGESIIGSIQTGLTNKVLDFATSVQELCKGIKTTFEGVGTYWTSVGEKITSDITTGIENKAADLQTTSKSTAGKAESAFRNVGWTSIGNHIIAGIISGINSSESSLTSKMESLANNIKTTIQNALEIGSPSRVMADGVGRWIPEGIALGIENNTGIVEDAMNDLAATTVGADLNGALAAQGSGFGSMADILSSGSGDSGLFGQIVAAVREGLKNAVIPVYMDGRKVSERVDEYLGDALAAWRFA